MQRALVILLALLPLGATAREFTIVVYNVENLFDVDGVAGFKDYDGPERNPDNSYTPARFLTKLEHIVEVLWAVNDGNGPEVILFQEFERDRTPRYSTAPIPELVEPWRDTSVATMLGEGFNAHLADLPAEAFLWKLLEEKGLGRYDVVKPDSEMTRNPSVHTNVVFSRFPVRWVKQRAMDEARELLIVGLDIDGHELIVMNNHWKSGASRRETNPHRRRNAQVVREELDSILIKNPLADVIVAGDLNAHYNQSAIFPEWGVVGINDILGSQTDEAALLHEDGPLLYNLWGELDERERGSEVYRGEWGTLMQMMLTRGLYDHQGIQYIDNSFFRLILPGRNADPHFHTPLRWIPFGDGGGFSDHLPIGARFRVVAADSVEEGFLTLTNPTLERAPPGILRPVDFEDFDRSGIASATTLIGLTPNELNEKMGQLFIVRGVIGEGGPGTIEIGGVSFGLYAPVPAVRERLEEFPSGQPLHAIGQLGYYRGTVQFVIRELSWILE